MGVEEDFKQKRAFVNDFYKRQIQLFGLEKQKKLGDKSIAIVGCGGLGCSIGLALGSSGIKNIHLIDFDKIELHNIHRQIVFKINDTGKYKAKVLAKFLKKRVIKNINIHFHICRFEDFAKKNMHLDLILDASDNYLLRSEIDMYCKKNNLEWIYAAVEKFEGQVCFFQKAKFKNLFKTQNNESTGQIAPMVMQVASFSANLALRYLADYKVKKDRVYYFFYNGDGEFLQRSFEL